ncbi:MAG: hypothetical protein HQ515_24810 [Phycisphaeraceae bacterium]|nr:hypothetical protein [Phycisphaeraceae bacterium]
MIGNENREMGSRIVSTCVGWGLCWGMLLVTAPSQAWAVEFAGGTGEPNDPFQIATPEQLIAIDSDPELLDKNFVLVADIDLDPNLPGGRVFTDALIAQDTGDSVSGHSGDSFEGVLDGQGHTIANMHIVGVHGYDAGLIGNLSGLVKELRLSDVVVSGSPCGAIAGLNHRNGMILRCEVSGHLSGTESVGGFVGTNWDGSLVECQAQVQISGEERVGGMVGGGPGGTLIRCQAQAEIYGENDIGGLVGQSSGGQIIECGVNGLVIGSNNVGGLVGTSRDTLVLRSSADCDVTGQRMVGGLLGNASSAFGPTLISDSYALGSVAGSVVGGLVGQVNRKRCLNCYSACELIALPVENEELWIGGLFGSIRRGNETQTSISCFWDAELSGVSIADGANPMEPATGLTTEQMQDQNILRDAGWDFNHVWTICEGDYPRLQWQAEDCGDSQ